MIPKRIGRIAPGFQVSPGIVHIGGEHIRIGIQPLRDVALVVELIPDLAHADFIALLITGTGYVFLS
jgi:hypothetical protein